MSADASLPASYFDRIYAADPDPWQFESSAYEDAKYTRSLAALPARRFPRALEIGCSIGVLTERLAAHCDELLAVDVSAVALERARTRCMGQRGVRFALSQVPQEFPPGEFDLIVVSEVGYYWSRSDLRLSAAAIFNALGDNGVLLLVHWTDPVSDYPLDGDVVHEHFLERGSAAGLRHALAERHPRYRLDVLIRRRLADQASDDAGSR
jgi:SAM-dependent methyltransferase